MFIRMVSADKSASCRRRNNQCVDRTHRKRYGARHVLGCFGSGGGRQVGRLRTCGAGADAALLYVLRGGTVIGVGVDRRGKSPADLGRHPVKTRTWPTGHDTSSLWSVPQTWDGNITSFQRSLCYNSAVTIVKTKKKKTCFYQNVTLVVLSKPAGTAVVVTRCVVRCGRRCSCPRSTSLTRRGRGRHPLLTTRNYNDGKTRTVFPLCSPRHPAAPKTSIAVKPVFAGYLLDFKRIKKYRAVVLTNNIKKPLAYNLNLQIRQHARYPVTIDYLYLFRLLPYVYIYHDQ